MNEKTHAESASAKAIHRIAAVAAVLLTLCLVFMMPVGATEYEAQIVDGDSYATLQDAINDAEDGATINILRDIVNNTASTATGHGNGVYVIDKPLTIDGQGHEIKTEEVRDLFRVVASTTFQNVNLTTDKTGLSDSYASLINIRTNGIEVHIENSNLSALNYYTQAVSVANDNQKLWVNDSTIKAGHYPLIVWGNSSEITIQESVLSGYSALYFRNHIGSSVSVSASSLIGTNAVSGDTNDFGVIVIQARGIQVDISGDSELTAVKSGSATQAILRFSGDDSGSGYDCSGAAIRITDSTLETRDGSTFKSIGDQAGETLTPDKVLGAGVTANFNPSEYVAEGCFSYAESGTQYVVSSIPTNRPVASVEPLTEEEGPTLETNGYTLTFGVNFTDLTTDPTIIAYYSDWYVDFIIETNYDMLIGNDTSDPGQLPVGFLSWGDEWIIVPDTEFDSDLVNVHLTAHQKYPVMAHAAITTDRSDLMQNYSTIHNSVRTFYCGMNISDAFMTEHPDLVVNLTVMMMNPADLDGVDDLNDLAAITTDAVPIGETYQFALPWTIECVDSDGTTLLTGYPRTYTVLTETFTLETPTRNGYNFAGWKNLTDGSAGESLQTVTISKGTFGDKKYQAQWTAKQTSNTGTASSSSSSKPKEETPVEPETPAEPETPVVPGEPTVETEVTNGGEVQFETPAADDETGEPGDAPADDETGEPGDAPADEPAEPAITGVVLPEGTNSEVAFVPVSETPAPAGKEENTKKVFEINVPTYEKGKPATVKFQMTVAELAADGKEAADVALWHFDEETGEWTKLVTTFVIIDGVVYFEAITFDFSPFAIIYEEEPAEEPTEEPTETPAPILAVLAGLGTAVVLRRK